MPNGRIVERLGRRAKGISLCALLVYFVAHKRRTEFPVGGGGLLIIYRSCRDTAWMEITEGQRPIDESGWDWIQRTGIGDS